MANWQDNIAINLDSLVFIDSNLNNYQTLIPEINNTEVIILDRSSNGIEQITEVLAQRNELTEIHILAHGNNGQLNLGNAVLTTDNLDLYKNNLSSWGNALTEDADILVYGCNLASNTVGLNFVEQLRDLTTADIAASDDLTGHSSLGGDWDLEITTGSIEADIAIDSSSQASYQGQLGINIGESGTVSNLNEQWQTVRLSGEYNNPVVIVGPPSYNGKHSSTVRVRNVTENSFQVRIEEWEYLDEIHPFREKIGYLVVEEGTHILNDGTKIVAGTESQVNHQWKPISFHESFSQTPVVLAQTTTERGTDTVTERIRNLNGSGFQVKLQEEEAADGFHVDENLSWIAINSGNGALGQQQYFSGKINVDENARSISFREFGSNSPVLLASTNSYQGADPVAIRYTQLNSTNASLFLEEEQSQDAEINHVNETVGFLALTPGLITVENTLDNGLVGYWQFNEVTHTVAVTDASGNGNNGTNVNINPGITSYSGPINSAPIFAKFNPRSWNFDGVDDYVRIDNSPELDFSNGQFTQSVWIRPTIDDNDFHGILGYQNGANRDRAPGLWVYDQTKIHAGFGDGTNWNRFTTGDVLTLNEWNHVVSSFDGTSYKIYVDGQEVFTTNAFAGTRPTSVQRLDIGRVDNYFAGQIDEVRLYNRALNNSEIQNLYVEQPNQAEVGDWSSPIDFPNIPVAAAVLPNGKIVTWSAWDRFTFGGRNTPRQSFTSVWDPETGEVGEVLVTNTEHDMFCPGIAMLPDGRLLVNGGGEFVRSTSIYDFETETWSDADEMEYRRWYNTSLTLSNGEVFTLGGEWNDSGTGRITTGVGEIWNETTGWRTLSGTPIAPIANSGDRGTEHPQLFLAPNGKVFAAGPSPTMYWYDLAGNGSISEAGTRGDSPYAQVGAAIMYDVGKILTTGGSNKYSGSGSVYDTVYAIDINNESAVTVNKQDSLHYGRDYQTGVVLPNGEVMIVGGEQGNKTFNDSQAVYRPELWNPETGAWTLLDNHEIPRTYHSVALLLPDGRVMAGGGGLRGEGSPVNHPDVEIFTPPYLYNEDGTLADRPIISSGADAVGYNQSFSITMDTDMSIAEFNLVRMSAVTHGVNTDQRFLSVDFTNQGNNTYGLISPDNGNIAPPGQYMLFAINDRGVPSEAKIIQIS